MCRPRLTFMMLVWLVAACDADSSTAPTSPISPRRPTLPPRDEMPGTVVVRVSTQGDSLDPDGYVVRVFRVKDWTDVSRRLVGDREESFDLSPGYYIVILKDVASHCGVQENPPYGSLGVSVQPGGTIVLEFHVACSATPGRLRIRLELNTDNWCGSEWWWSCSGPPDEDFAVLIDDQLSRRGLDAGFDVYPITAGAHTVTLQASPSCWVAAEIGGDIVHGATVTVHVPLWDTAEVKFDVFC